MSTGHDVADARLHRTVAALSARGLSVEVIALGSAADAPPHASFRGLGARGGFAARGLGALTMPFRAAGRVLMVIDPDTVAPAALAARLRGRRLVVDVHEDYLALLEDRGWARSTVGAAARLVAHSATALAARADLTVVADAHVPPRRARHRLVVRNLPDLSALPKPGPLDSVPRAVYIGDVRRSRGLQWMVEAVENSPPWRLDLIGPVAATDAVWLADHPANPRIRAHGRLPLHRAWELAQGAWAGMCLLEDTPAFRAAVPTKLYEYLGCGLALLASPLPRIADIVGSSGGGQVVADPAAASAVLDAWYTDPDRLRDAQAAARRWAEVHLTGRSPFDELAAAVAALIEGGAGGDEARMGSSDEPASDEPASDEPASDEPASNELVGNGVGRPDDTRAAGVAETVRGAADPPHTPNRPLRRPKSLFGNPRP